MGVNSQIDQDSMDGSPGKFIFSKIGGFCRAKITL